MELKQIKELMAAMEKAGIKKLRIKEKGYEVELERSEEHPIPSHVVTVPTYAHPDIHGRFPLHTSPAYPRVEPEPPKIEEQKAEPVGKFVTSPMVGTFYTSPSPDDPAFVKVGDSVSESTVLCIIEAMKVMNEVKAGIKGTVAEVLIQSAHPVEFGTKLFRIT